MGCGVPAGVWIITISILTYGICAVNRNEVPVWESSVPILCQWRGKGRKGVLLRIEKLLGSNDKNLTNLFLVLRSVFVYTKDTLKRKRWVV